MSHGSLASRRNGFAKRSGRMFLGSAGVAAFIVSAPIPAAHGSVLTSAARPITSAPQFSTPIQHVVFLIQENHSFDNILGAWCAQTSRCDGTTTGLLYGQTTPIGLAGRSLGHHASLDLINHDECIGLS